MKEVYNRPVHFEIHAEDCQRAMKFYGDLFGWTFQEWKGGDTEYHMVMTGAQEDPGINGGMVKRMGPNPAPGGPVTGYVCTMAVENLDAMMEKAQSLGGIVAVPKGAIPTMGWLGYMIDSEKNIFGMMQPDPTAK